MRGFVSSGSIGGRHWGWTLAISILGLALLVGLRGKEWREGYAKAHQRWEAREADRLRELAEKGENTANAFPRKPELLIATKYLAPAYIGKGAVVSLVLALGLFATRRHWAVESGATDIRPIRLVDRGARVFWVGVSLALILGGSMRAARMPLSLYNDEIYSWRDSVAGEFPPATEIGVTPAFEARTWLETIFRNKKGNAGVPFNALSRLGVDAWRWATKMPPGAVCEWAFRWPSFVGGMLSIVMVALLGRSLYSSYAGIVAAALAAIHPWHLRYSTEGRCYGLLLFLFPFTLHALHRAWRSPGFGWWLAYGMGVFLCFYSFLLMLYPLAALNGVMLAIAWFERRKAEPGAKTRTVRLLAANLWGAMVACPLMFPLLVQAAAAIDQPGLFKGMKEQPGLAFFGDVISNASIGAPLIDLDPANPVNPSLPKLESAHPILVTTFLVFWMAAIGLGLWRASGSTWVWRWLAIHGLGVLICWVAVRLSETLLNPWYLIWTLPFLLVVAAGGVDAMAAQPWRYLPWLGTDRRWPATVGFTAILLSVAVLAPINRNYLAFSREAPADAVRTIHQSIFPFPPQAPDAVVACVYSLAPVYDPQMIKIADVETLKRLKDEATEEGKPFYVLTSLMEVEDIRRQPEMSLLLDEREFELVKVFPGIEEAMYTQYLFRSQSGAARQGGKSPGSERRHPIAGR